ncbi:MAG: phage tail tape measure protein [Sulfitobacter sp.]
MSNYDGFENLSDYAEALNQTLGESGTLVSGFDSELRRMRSALAATGKDVATLEKGLNSGLRRAFDGVMFDGMKLSDALKTVAQSLSNSAYNAAIKPVTDHVGGLITQGVSGLVQSALPFAAASGPAASLPLGLGGGAGSAAPTSAAAGSYLPAAASVVMNISTPDVQGFQRSQSQIAAQMSRALAAGNRNR